MVGVMILFLLKVFVNFGGDDVDADENKLLEGGKVLFFVDGGKEIPDVGFVKYFLHFNYSYIIRIFHIFYFKLIDLQWATPTPKINLNPPNSPSTNATKIISILNSKMISTKVSNAATKPESSASLSAVPSAGSSPS